MRKAQFMGTYIGILIVGLAIGIGLVYFMLTRGMLTDIFCPAVP